MAVALEAAEPDDVFPVGLPLDDVGRRALLAGAREALDRGGEEGFQIYIRHHLGTNADTVFNHIGMPQHNINVSNLIFDTQDHANTAARRGWLIDDIEDLVTNPALTRKGTNLATGNSATFFYRPDGNYAAIDDITNQIFHVSDPAKAGWKDPITNQVIQPITLP